MAPFIGAATSRVDGHAKVTGGAKYAAEFNVSNLAYAGIVASTGLRSIRCAPRG